MGDIGVVVHWILAATVAVVLALVAVIKVLWERCEALNSANLICREEAAKLSVQNKYQSEQISDNKTAIEEVKQKALAAKAVADIASQKAIDADRTAILLAAKVDGISEHKRKTD